VKAAAASGLQLAPSNPQTAAKDMSNTITLDNIRTTLIRQEDTIIFDLIERAQYALNPPVYISGGVPVPAFGKDGRQYSLLEYVLRETEQLHGKVRRYTSPDEHAFYPEDEATLVLPPLAYPDSVLAPYAKEININSTIMDVYFNKILPDIAAPGDDGNYGSAATLDVLCLQALSKRIHYGKFVAEAKFRAKPEEYTALIEAQDAEGLMALLTDVKVEQKVVERVYLKAQTFGQDIQTPDGPAAAAAPRSSSPNGEPHFKVQPRVLADMYEELVMPLTKDVQVAYLLRRLDGQQQH